MGKLLLEEDKVGWAIAVVVALAIIYFVAKFIGMILGFIVDNAGLVTTISILAAIASAVYFFFKSDQD